jgi:two-component system sensor histidine kinase QseC
MRRLLGGAALAIAAMSIAVYLLVASSLEAQFDRNLADRVQGFASILFQVKDQVEFEFSEELMTEYAEDELPAYFELWHERGEVLERSPSLAGADLELVGEAGREPSYWNAALPDGRPGRFVAQRIEVHHVYPEQGPDRPEAANLLVMVARDRGELSHARQGVMVRCVGFGVLLLLLIAAVAWTAVERGLEPARRLAAKLDAIDVYELPGTFEAGELPRELAPVAEKTDALIRRVDTALQRERRTVADIAHELRTPISEILTTAEVALRNRQDPNLARKALSTVRDVTWRMGGSVSTLLRLARLEMGSESFEREPVNVGALVSEVLRSLGSLTMERELDVENRVPPRALALADAEALRIVISNLLSNALYYSPPGSKVVCSLENTVAGWRFLVQNETNNLEVQDLAALTEPFWRKDSSRTDRNRSGLGLALSHALAQRIGMRLSFELDRTTLLASLTCSAEQLELPAANAANPKPLSKTHDSA